MSNEINSNPPVLHFIPQHGIGGAEIAACSATIDPKTNVYVHGIFNGLYTGAGSIDNARMSGSPTRIAFSPRSIFAAVRRAVELKPKVFVFSLWRSFGVFVALKLLYRRRKFVTFVHNERVANFADRYLTALMKRGADEIWVDSQATFEARLSETEKKRARIISLRLERSQLSSRTEPTPIFIYWGRLAQQKRIDRAIALFAEIAKQRSDARMVLIGPDHGVKEKLVALAQSLGIADHVSFEGPKGHREILDAASGAKFFIQLSDHEGMAMGVVEALEAGLVPIVTPVGQMAVYCRHGQNALVYRDRNGTVDQLLTLLEEPGRYAAMSRAALQTFANSPIYREDVAAAARALVAR